MSIDTTMGGCNDKMADLFLSLKPQWSVFKEPRISTYCHGSNFLSLQPDIAASHLQNKTQHSNERL